MDGDIRRRTMGKVSRHFIPFMIAMFCVNFLDRVNIGFAALQMNRDLGLTPETYGFAAGILFIPYALAEVPSNIILDRVGPRIWLARIMITWGVISCLNAFVWDKYSLYALRCLLGFAEAGFFPGLMVFLIRWFPAQERARAVTIFMLGSPISVIFGGPLSTLILSLDGTFGIAGWKYLLFVEGIPAVILGVLALRWLTDNPLKADWLLPEEPSRRLFGTYDSGMEMFFISGMFLVLGATILIVQNTDLLLRLISWLGGRLFPSHLPWLELGPETTLPRRDAAEVQ